MSIMPLPDDQRLFRPRFPFGDDYFTLGAPVGPGQPNRREDVLKIETILGNLGRHDLGAASGPLGWWGEAHETAVKGWQGDNGLKVDGVLKPGGPTIGSLRKVAGGLLGGFTPPSPDQVDEHHARLYQGEAGLLNTRPARLSLPKPDAPLELDEQSLAFNADTARALTKSSVDGDVPAIYADFLKQAGADGHATVFDLAEQIDASSGRDRADRVLHGTVGRLPGDGAKALLGGTPPATRPLGVLTAELSNDSTAPLFKAAAAKAEGDGKILSAPIPPTVTPGPIPPPNPGETDIHIPADPKPEPENTPVPTPPASNTPPPTGEDTPDRTPAQRDAEVLQDPANVPGYAQWLAEGAKNDPQWAEQHAKDVGREVAKDNPQAGEDTFDRTAVQRDAEVLKDPANVPGYTRWLGEGAKKDPQWAEQHAKEVSREVYKNNPQAAEEMVRQGEKAGVKVGLYADGHQAS